MAPVFSRRLTEKLLFESSKKKMFFFNKMVDILLAAGTSAPNCLFYIILAKRKE